MRKIFQYILMAVAVVVTASCSNELDEALQQPADNGNLQFVVSDFPAFGEDGQTRAIGTPDAGKTAWADGDKILVHLYSQECGHQAVTLTFDEENNIWNSDSDAYCNLSEETPTITAVYAPDCEIKEGQIALQDGKQYGMAEYIQAKTQIDGNTVNISFEGVSRTYSRLRIAAASGASLTVATTGFTPAGAVDSSSEPDEVAQTDEPVTYTLTADKKGNAYLYGTFTANATVGVKQGKEDLTDHTFTGATEMGVSYALDCPWPYLTFTAEAEQTMKITAVNSGYDHYWHESMEYSVNGGEWAQLAKETAISFGRDKGTLRLRGKSLYGTSYNGWGDHSKVSFGKSDVKVACSGDIRTLVDYENYATVSTANAKFVCLFDGCVCLTTAPELPATELAQSCYKKMFQGCTNLTKAPELPATELAEYCYQYMFEGCTSLTEAPEILPATTLAQNCYERMFQGCTNLTKAPELPATKLAQNCYERMFFGCTNLTKAPELSATTLAKNCCNYMFYGCTSLTEAPALPATTLDYGCYQYMFKGCTSLTKAPALPATTLAEYCYQDMFEDCTSLTEAPELPATTLANYCYRKMFKDCSALNNITMLATNISATDCLKEWVSGVASTGTFYKNSGATWDVTGINGIPGGWTVENKE